MYPTRFEMDPPPLDRAQARLVTYSQPRLNQCLLIQNNRQMGAGGFGQVFRGWIFEPVGGTFARRDCVLKFPKQIAEKVMLFQARPPGKDGLTISFNQNIIMQHKAAFLDLVKHVQRDMLTEFEMAEIISDSMIARRWRGDRPEEHIGKPIERMPLPIYHAMLDELASMALVPGYENLHQYFALETLTIQIQGEQHGTVIPYLVTSPCDGNVNDLVRRQPQYFKLSWPLQCFNPGDQEVHDGLRATPPLYLWQNMVRQVCAAVRYLHHVCGVAHWDIKDLNIFYNHMYLDSDPPQTKIRCKQNEEGFALQVSEKAREIFNGVPDDFKCYRFYLSDFGLASSDANHFTEASRPNDYVYWPPEAWLHVPVQPPEQYVPDMSFDSSVIERAGWPGYTEQKTWLGANNAYLTLDADARAWPDCLTGRGVDAYSVGVFAFGCLDLSAIVPLNDPVFNPIFNKPSGRDTSQTHYNAMRLFFDSPYWGEFLTKANTPDGTKTLLMMLQNAFTTTNREATALDAAYSYFGLDGAHIDARIRDLNRIRAAGNAVVQNKRARTSSGVP